MTNKDKKIEKFNQWLSCYQEDLSRIVGKYRFANHALEHDEVISEINLGVIKSYEKLALDSEKPVKTESDFKKIVYSYARNYIKWTADGVSNRDKKYIMNRQDGVVTFDGEGKTVFESICETIGKEDSFFASLNDSDKFQNILSWIFDFSHFLTPHQKNILELLLSGKNLDEVGDLTGVSHQAISSISIEMFAAIKNNVKVSIGDDDSDKLKIKEGYSSIKKLFSLERKSRMMNLKDLSFIKSRLIENPKKYTLIDLVDMLKGKYSSRQICAYVNRNKYNIYLKKIADKT